MPQEASCFSGLSLVALGGGSSWVPEPWAFYRISLGPDHPSCRGCTPNLQTPCVLGTSEPETSANRRDHEERSVMAFKKFLSSAAQCYANYRSSLLGIWIGYVSPFCLRCFSYLPRVPYELVPMTFISIVLSLCFPQSNFARFFLFLLMRRKITVTFHAHINIWDESGWEQNMASKLYPECNNHYTNCFSLVHSR